MKRFNLLLVFVVLLIGLTACRSAGQSPQGVLNRNRNSWNDQAPSHYQFTLQVGCFCVPDFTRPVQIEVRDGTVVSKSYADNGQAVNNDFFESYDTMDELFAVIEKAIEDEADVIDIAYHPDYGYPEQISLDYIKEALDDEVAYRVLTFSVLP